MIAASQGQNDVAVGYGLLSAASLFAASLNDASSNAKPKQAALLARQQAEAEERRRIAALVAGEQRRKDELAISALKTETPGSLQLKSLSEMQSLDAPRGWDGADPNAPQLPDPDRPIIPGETTVAVLAPDKKWNAPRCEAQVAELRRLDEKMTREMQELRSDLQKDARGFLSKQYGVDDAKSKAKNALFDSLRVRQLYEEASGYFNSSFVEFATCTQCSRPSRGAPKRMKR